MPVRKHRPMHGRFPHGMVLLRWPMMMLSPWDPCNERTNFDTRMARLLWFRISMLNRSEDDFEWRNHGQMNRMLLTTVIKLKIQPTSDVTTDYKGVREARCDWSLDEMTLASKHRHKVNHHVWSSQTCRLLRSLWCRKGNSYWSSHEEVSRCHSGQWAKSRTQARLWQGSCSTRIGPLFDDIILSL